MSKTKRKSKLDSVTREVLLNLYQEGKTDAEAARILGVSVRTIYRWRAKDAELCHAIKEAKEIANARVEASLYLRATGFWFPSESIFFRAGKPIRVETMKHCPPDTTAAIFWLKNRQPDRWR